MNVTDETKAELRRLHAEFTRADEQLARATLNANERRMRQEAADEAERYLAHAWIGHGPSVLDALAAAEAERDKMRAALEEIVDPLPALHRRAVANGHRLSGMACEIAHSRSHAVSIARAALGATP